MEKMVAKRGEEEERRKYRRRRRRITFDDDDYDDENNRTIRHAAKRWLREERTGRRFNLVITSTHDSRRAPMTKGPSVVTIPERSRASSRKLTRTRPGVCGTC